ncbi:MAG: GHKL domain-containing protein [Phycisphaerales bacterium]|nr:MAG: GHKL domain-containing protein [Phycisphaerales bacterium]
MEAQRQPNNTVQLHRGSTTDPSSTRPGLGSLGKSVLDALPIGVVIFDRDLKVVEASSRATALIKLGNRIDKSLAQGTEGPERPGIDWKLQLISALSSESPCSFEPVSSKLDGKKTALKITCMPLRQAGKPAASLGGVLIEDVTDRVHLEKELADTERLAALGKLTSKVAHELNDPIDGILRYINLATRIVEYENLDKPIEYLARCREGLMRMIQIVSELLGFSRGSRIVSENVKIEQIIEDALRTIDARTESSRIELVRNYAALPAMRSGNLFQVFCNIIKNAYDAMPEGGQLHITTRLAADAVVVEFRDTGTGFSPENSEALFEPFFTTKDKSKGTGLGLAICKDIIERHKGQLTAENAPGGGSIFTVYLPLPSGS